MVAKPADQQISILGRFVQQKISGKIYRFSGRVLRRGDPIRIPALNLPGIEEVLRRQAFPARLIFDAKLDADPFADGKRRAGIAGGLLGRDSPARIPKQPLSCGNPDLVSALRFGDFIR